MQMVYLILSLLTQETEVRKLDELSIKRLFFAAQNEQHVAFTYASGGMSFELGIYDFTTDRVVLIRDGRVKLFIAFPVPWQEGFAVLNTVGGTVFFLQADGRLSKKATWTDFEGWELGYKLTYLAPMQGTGKALATIIDKEARQYLLAVINLNQESVEIIYSQAIHNDDLQRYWLPYQDSYISMVPQTEQIDHLGKDDFKSLKTLRIAREVMKKQRARRGSQYIKLLDQPIQVGEAMYFRWLPYRDPLNSGDDSIEPRTLMLKEAMVKEVDAYVIGAYGGNQLGFVWEDYELKVVQ